MADKGVVEEEYRVLREEIVARIKLLHQIILTASFLGALFLIGGAWLVSVSKAGLVFYLLVIPIIFAGVVFNYQDNQRTLEATARYIEEELRPKLGGLAWERYLAAHKKRFQVSSAFKLFALLAPFILPIIVMLHYELNPAQSVLAWIDLLLLLVILVNFQYKLYRIK